MRKLARHTVRLKRLACEIKQQLLVQAEAIRHRALNRDFVADLQEPGVGRDLDVQDMRKHRPLMCPRARKTSSEETKQT